MTFPGADTMKAGIKGDDCFRFSGVERAGSNCEGMVLLGDGSGVWVACEMLRGNLRVSARRVGQRGLRLVRYTKSKGRGAPSLPGGSWALLRTLPLAAMSARSGKTVSGWGRAGVQLGRQPARRR